MSWSGTKRSLWGDEPQDLVDEVVESKLGKDWWKDPNSTPAYRKREVFDLLLKNKELKKQVDEIYKREFGRPANKSEYKNLLRVSLGLGGSTKGGK